MTRVGYKRRPVYRVQVFDGFTTVTPLMKTITTTVNLYRFNELTTKAKDHARECLRQWKGYERAEEAVDSLRTLAEYFGGRLLGWSIDYFGGSHSSAKFDFPELDPDDIEASLEALGTYDPVTFRGTGECKLTGYCHDESAIDGFRIAWFRGERDLDTLVQAGFKTWLEATQEDCADQYSDETLGAHCEANDYDFTEYGQLYKG